MLLSKLQDAEEAKISRYKERYENSMLYEESLMYNKDIATWT